MVSLKTARRLRRLRPIMLGTTALFIAGIVHLGGYYAFQVELPGEQRVDFASPFVRFSPAADTETGALVAEQAVLFDSAPLFMPTEWNTAAAMSSPAGGAAAAPLFGEIQPVITLNDSFFDNAPTRQLPSPETPEDSLAPIYWRMFSSFGTMAKTVSELPRRAAFMEIWDISRQQPVLRSDVSVDALPSSLESLWSPAEFLVLVAPQGAIGEPSLAQSTGSEETDSLLRSALPRLLLNRGLQEGYFRIVIGP